MPLTMTYPADFTLIYKAYPKWPTGRTKKHLAYKKWVAVKREFNMNAGDVAELVDVIEGMKIDRKSWQKGSEFGPQALQVFLHQSGWQDEYERIGQAKTQSDRLTRLVSSESAEESNQKYWAELERRQGPEAVPAQYRSRT